jgi:hypothetical protein
VPSNTNDKTLPTFQYGHAKNFPKRTINYIRPEISFRQTEGCKQTNHLLHGPCREDGSKENI